ncbi:helix-turn-helix domain-containing protein [Microbulbifer marinus]|nr:helix-turn-helix domain-containing protein [Microbulbifer marinus]
MPRSGRITYFTFSSSAYSPEDREAAFAEVYSPICGVEIQGVGRDGTVEAAGLEMPQVAVAQLQISPHQSRRTYSHIADGDDSLMLVMPTSGNATFSFRDKQPETFAPGQVYLAPLEDPFEAGCSDFLNVTSISLPGKIFERRLADPDSVIAKKSTPTDSASLTLLLRYVADLVDAREKISAQAASVASLHIQDLAALVLQVDAETEHAARNRGLKEARFRAVRHYIYENLKNPELNVDRVAAHLHISPQYVRKMFYDAGMSFCDYLIGLRLDWVYRQLLIPAFPRESVSALAYKVGFNNLAWFNRAFKRRFNLTPSEVRANSSSGEAS